jgi:hypothetical protein
MPPMHYWIWRVEKYLQYPGYPADAELTLLSPSYEECVASMPPSHGIGFGKSRKTHPSSPLLYVQECFFS